MTDAAFHVIHYLRVRNVEVNGLERGVYALSCSCGWTAEVVGWKAMTGVKRAHERGDET